MQPRPEAGKQLWLFLFGEGMGLAVRGEGSGMGKGPSLGMAGSAQKPVFFLHTHSVPTVLPCSHGYSQEGLWLLLGDISPTL